jgi:Holliday junction resolvase
MVNSRAKGAAAERELAAYLRSKGFEARRGQQFCGSPDSPDVVCDDFPFHIESKRCERVELWKWIEQARRDAGGKPWAVCHRKNREGWVVVIDLDELLKLIGGEDD